MGFKWSQFLFYINSPIFGKDGTLGSKTGGLQPQIPGIGVRNEVNEFGFTPLTLDFEAFVRFIRQVSWKPVTF